MAAKQKILIVDDERAIAHALELKLTHTGYDATVVGDGELALEALGKDTFNLMLLDLVMPKMDGFTVLAEMKKRKLTVPVIVSSNLSQEEDIKRAKELGAKDYFIKSNTPLVQIVEKIQAFLK